MPRIKPGPPCAVCGRPSVARELCDLHYRRFLHHGHLDQTRPATWGQNNKHPLWESWKHTKRLGRVPEWDDFWVFVGDVGERPDSKHKLRKRDLSKPAGPDNSYWAERTSSAVDDDFRAGRARYARDWRKANPLRAKANDLRKMFGIELADYEAMLTAQGGVCAICGGTDKHYRLAVDHDHGSGKVRGLLCVDCNRAIGMFKDSPELLRKAADYLSR